MKKRFFLFLAHMVKKTGVRGVARLADFFGAVMWRILRKRREATVRRVATHLDLPEDEARRIARASFSHTARSFLDILIAGKHGSPEIPFSNDAWRDLIERLRTTERPIVVISGHFGPWEITGAMASRVKNKRVFSIVRRYRDQAMHEFIRELRHEYGLETVDHRDASGIVLSTLREGGIACFLADHNTSRKEAIFLPFLGEDAAVNMGPALLAIRAQALVQPVYARRENDGSITILFDDPLDTRELTGTVAERVRKTAEFYTEAAERHIRACPEQWFWMHDRWKTRPLEEARNKGE